jgi:hypothetical protein
VVDISSVGGDIYAAMRIDRELRRNLGSVESGFPSVCYSACVFIVTGAVGGSADVGIHRPYFLQASAATLAETDSRYKKLMADVHACLREMKTQGAAERGRCFVPRQACFPKDVLPLVELKKHRSLGAKRQQQFARLRDRRSSPARQFTAAERGGRGRKPQNAAWR